MPDAPASFVAQVVAQSRELKAHDMNALAPFLKKAGWITRLISPFLDLDCVFATQTTDIETTEDDISIYNKVMALHPQLKDVIAEFSKEDEDSDAYPNFIAQMTRKMNSARGTDTNLVKYQVLNFLPPNASTPITTREKDVRGWHHKSTARALCPLQFIDEFDEDPLEFMKLVQDGRFKPLAKYLPSFLYPEGTVYDPLHLDRGLFRSNTIIKALRLIYTGGSSTEDGRRANTKPSQAEMHGMTSVMPEMVAYAACQIYFSLTSTRSWVYKIGYFNLETFHRNIIRLFTADPESPWSVSTLKYLTDSMPTLRRITKRKRAEDNDSDEEESDEDDPTGVLRARARAAQALEADQARAELEAQAAVNNQTPEPQNNTDQRRHESEEPLPPPPPMPPTTPRTSPAPAHDNARTSTRPNSPLTPSPATPPLSPAPGASGHPPATSPPSSTSDALATGTRKGKAKAKSVGKRDGGSRKRGSGK